MAHSIFHSVPDAPSQARADTAAAESGFTLIELIVVMVIVSVLIAASMIAYQSSKSSARTGAVRGAALAYKEGVEAFRLDHGARSPAFSSTFNHTTDWPTSAAQIDKGPLNASQAADFSSPGKPYHPDVPQIILQNNAELLTSTATPSSSLPVLMAVGYQKTGPNTYTIMGWTRKNHGSPWVVVCTLGVGVSGGEKC